MECEVPHRHISRSTLSIDTVQQVLRWERRKRCSSRKRRHERMTKNCCYVKMLMNFSFEEEKIKTREDKRMAVLEFFGHVLKKISTFTFWCMVIPLGPHSIYT